VAVPFISYFFVGSIGAGGSGGEGVPTTCSPFILSLPFSESSGACLPFFAWRSMSLACSRGLLDTSPTSYKGYERIRINYSASPHAALHPPDLPIRVTKKYELIALLCRIPVLRWPSGALVFALFAEDEPPSFEVTQNRGDPAGGLIAPEEAADLGTGHSIGGGCPQ
jgi:hypothetical protein